MKIAHFVSNFPRDNGGKVYGKSLAAYYLCLALAKRGNDVHVFTISEETKDEIIYENGITIHSYGAILSYKSEKFSYKILSDPLKHDFDLVHVHSGISIEVLAGYRYAKMKNKPFIITWHGDSVRGYGRYTGMISGSAAFFYQHYLADKFLSAADLIISPSSYYVDVSVFLKKYKSKIVSIPNGINFNDFKISYSKEECKKKLGFEGKKVILFVGSLLPLKGPQILLKSIPSIIRQIDDVIFVFLGDGNLEEYKLLSKDMGICNYVNFAGYVSGKRKTMYYNASDIFVLPSTEFFEVFPLVLLEAAVSSLPMVVSNLETFKCIVKEKYNGIFFKMRDEKSLSFFLLDLLKNDTVREKMGYNARMSVKEFSWDNIALKTETMYSKLLYGN